ncbi:glycosyltransferase family 4 protein [Ralstonia mannitolilytica]|uniref:glycosyltransferase family 4 protein n=1 Tax=Ralstonia mannitolilytica TaxID=105219 RepID=UPI0028F69A6C|nr:glycosyltransferase family 4 protein [Ralstonia mannitolilytica]CAJ0894396.1 D-inositol-3-phosphate glycosyltransferase [Ralstonia mannitolilytica]
MKTKTGLSEVREVRPSIDVAVSGERSRQIMISTTVPETFSAILKGQPSYLAREFRVILATSPGEVLEQVEKDERLPIYEVPMVRGICVWRDIASVLRMIAVLRQVKPELVHSYTPKAGLVTMLAAKLCGVPVRVHTFTGLIFPTSTGFRKWLLIWIDRIICFCATKIVPEGNGVKHDLERYGITKKPLSVIGYGNVAGVDTQAFSPENFEVRQAARNLRLELSIDEAEFVFCFVGRLNRDKGITELVEAFSTLKGRVHLILVGSVDSTAPVDDVTLQAIEAHARIHCLGFVHDVRPALLASDVLVLPSYREGFPNVVLQAGAMGVPVIATDVNGSNEIIENGFNGWLIPPRNAAALGLAMQQALDMPPTERRDMGQRGRGRVVQRFERREHWARMAEFYDELLHRSPAHTAAKR